MYNICWSGVVVIFDDIGGDSVYCGGQYLYLFGDNDDNNEKLWWMIKIHIELR